MTSVAFDGHLVSEVRHADGFRHLHFTNDLFLNLLNGFGMTVAILATTTTGGTPTRLTAIVITTGLDRTAMLAFIRITIVIILAALLTIGRMTLTATFI